MSFDSYLEDETIRHILPNSVPGIEPPPKPEKAKRPPNAYNLYFMESQTFIKGENPLLSGNQISQEIGKRWKEMDAEQRQPYIERANAIRERFRLDNPDYHYEKKSARKKKRKAKARALHQNSENEESHLSDFVNCFVSTILTQCIVQNKELTEPINATITPDLLPALIQSIREQK